MRLGGEIKLGWITPPAYFNVVICGLADRNRFMREIWNAGKELVETFFIIGDKFFAFLDFLAEFLGFGNECGSVLTTFLERSNLLRGTIPSRLHRFGLGNGLPTLGVDGAEILEHLGGVHPALAKFLLH